MCNFFSFVTEPEYHGGQRFYFNKEYRKVINNPDSHSTICDYNHLKEDKCNKYGYDFITRELKVDQINSPVDDRVQVEKWAHNLNLRNIIDAPELGTVFVFRPLEDILIDDRKGKIKCGWNSEGRMDYLVKDKVELVFDEDALTMYVTCNLLWAWKIDGWCISLSMPQVKQ